MMIPTNSTGVTMSMWGAGGAGTSTQYFGLTNVLKVMMVIFLILVVEVITMEEVDHIAVLLCLVVVEVIIRL